MRYNSQESADVGGDAVVVSDNGRHIELYNYGTTIINHEEEASYLSEVLGEVLSVADVPLKVCI